MDIRDYADDVARSVAFLSRVHVPQRHFIGHDGKLSRAVRAFPVAGVLIALPCAALVSVLMALHADPLLTAFLMLGLSTLITGALHEDGLADTADGLGGGRTKERALDIMKDSRIGTYGAASLILSFGLRAASIAAFAPWLNPGGAGFAILAVAAASRASMVWHWFTLPPARKDGVAASVGTPDTEAVYIGLATCLPLALLALVPFVGLATTLVTLAAIAAANVALTRHVRAKIGGHTGDTIGACQQLSEIAGLAALALLV